MRGGFAVLLSLPLCLGAAQEPSPSVPAGKSPPPSFADVVLLQKEVSSRKPDPEERFRLALVLAAAGQLEEAEGILASLKDPPARLAPYLELYLRRQLGEHREASKVLSRLLDEDRRATGFVIERAELCSKVRRFRDYDPAESDRVPPGGVVLLYVEPRNFVLRREGDRHSLRLRYEWRLFDARDVEVAVPAWRNASPEEREDHVTTVGPVSEFHQSFRLPLPADLAPAFYRVKIEVTDVHGGRSDRVYLPITVTAPAEAGR
jgi:hypothetical protein